MKTRALLISRKYIMCPYCGDNVFYYSGNQKPTTKDNKTLMFHCLNKVCRGTFQIRKKDRQSLLFNDKLYKIKNIEYKF